MLLKKKTGQTSEELQENSTENVENTASSTPVETLPPELTDPTNPKYKYVIKNKKARQQSKERKAVIIIAIILLALFAVGIVLYGFYSAVEINNFSIYVEKEGSKILSLSENSAFMPGTQHLEVSGPEHMDNTSLYLCPTGSTPIEHKLVDIVTTDGQITTKDDEYFATTFYLKNVTTEVQYFNEYFKILESTQGVEKALRVMLIKNYEITVYAEKKEVKDAEGNVVKDANGNPVLEAEKVVPTTKEENLYTPLYITTDQQGNCEIKHHDDPTPWMAEPFYDDDHVFYNKGYELKPGETMKYSLIVWLEGWDEDCVNEIIGGLLKIEFAFETTGKP